MPDTPVEWRRTLCLHPTKHTPHQAHNDPASHHGIRPLAQINNCRETSESHGFLLASRPSGTTVGFAETLIKTPRIQRRACLPYRTESCACLADCDLICPEESEGLAMEYAEPVLRTEPSRGSPAEEADIKATHILLIPRPKSRGVRPVFAGLSRMWAPCCHTALGTQSEHVDAPCRY
jgi:hypothetical protein